MTKRILLPAVAALALAGCQSEPAQDNAAVPVNTAEPINADAEANAIGNAAGPENALAAVLEMNDRQRNVVFIRALLDAGLPCEGVTSSERVDDLNGQPAWRATCVGGTSHLISISPDGTANIASRTDR
ncbi:hypothetical protein ACMGDH_12295 [Sphingomonas sp. DT-207]|uniref:hypothetical protein n=1 Tax=Sphingomonas sp. DT-207 TaxID=3396167 RepID=UPI003F1C19A2